MQHKFKLGALAWGIAAALAFPAGAAAARVGTVELPPADNNAAVCNQLATGNTGGAFQCGQNNTASNTQTTTTTGGNGGTATGGNGGPVQVVGNHSKAGSYGGDAYANGGDAESHCSLDNDQSNQISGRDSSGSDPASTATTEQTDSTGNNNAAVCNQLATGDAMGNNQCRQDNTSTNAQTTTTTGGNGGTATGGNAGPVQVVGDNSEAYSYGGDAYANGGDAESWTSLENEQSNQISGRDSPAWAYAVTGYNNAA